MEGTVPSTTIKKKNLILAIEDKKDNVCLLFYKKKGGECLEREID